MISQGTRLNPFYRVPNFFSRYLTFKQVKVSLHKIWQLKYLFLFSWEIRVGKLGKVNNELKRLKWIQFLGRFWDGKCLLWIKNIVATHLDIYSISFCNKRRKYLSYIFNGWIYDFPWIDEYFMNRRNAIVIYCQATKIRGQSLSFTPLDIDFKRLFFASHKLSRTFDANSRILVSL